MLRIRIVQTPAADTIDGIDLSQFARGQVYEVGNLVGSVLLAEGWAEPVAEDEPGVIVPFTESDPFVETPYRDADAPPNLTREHYPPYLNDRPELAFDFERRRSARRLALSRRTPKGGKGTP